VETATRSFVEAGELAGAAALIWRNGTVPEVVTVGRRDLVSGLPVQPRHHLPHRLARETSDDVAALSMLDEGRFALDEPIAGSAPELARLRVLRDPEGPLDQSDEAARPITFRDLLTHRSGLTYGDFHRGPIGRAYTNGLGATIDNPLTRDEWIARLGTLPLVDQAVRRHFRCP
jgi:CubicO group peptidase (beta-lactamase class C family)